LHRPKQGCQMVYFQTKNHNLGKFWRALDWKMLINFMAVWNILPTFGIFYDRLVHFVFIWYIFPVLVSVPTKIWQPWAEAVVPAHVVVGLQPSDNHRRRKNGFWFFCLTFILLLPFVLLWELPFWKRFNEITSLYVCVSPHLFLHTYIDIYAYLKFRFVPAFWKKYIFMFVQKGRHFYLQRIAPTNGCSW
jgi:hypothetical protein